MKTKKGGYLKDGFVVDSSDTEDVVSSETEDDNDDVSNDLSCEEESLLLEEIGSELSEEAYDYSDDDEK